MPSTASSSSDESSEDESSGNNANLEKASSSDDDEISIGDSRRQQVDTGSSSDEGSDESSDEDDSSGEEDVEDVEDGEKARESTDEHLSLGERLQRMEQPDHVINRKRRKDLFRKKHASMAKKRSKHAPTEVSSKKADHFRPKGLLAGVGVELPGVYQGNDPRGSSLHGHFSLDHFNHHYKFVIDRRKEEIKELRKRIKAHRITGRKGQQLRRRMKVRTTLEEDQELLNRLIQDQAVYERQEMDRQAARKVKQQINGSFKPKRRDEKRMHEQARLDVLKERRGDGAVAKDQAKRRKKLKSRHADYMRQDIRS